MTHYLTRPMASVAVDHHKVSELCQKSLDTKWNNLSWKSINNECPFCRVALFKNSAYMNCWDCLCPPEICGKHSRTGFIATLKLKYGSSQQVRRLDRKDLDHMRSLFQKYILPATQE